LSPSVNHHTSITESRTERLRDGRWQTTHYGSSSGDNTGGVGIGLRAGVAGLSVEGIERTQWGQSFDVELMLRYCLDTGICLGLDGGKAYQQSSFSVRAPPGVATEYDDRTLEAAGFYAVPVVQFGGEVVWAEAGLGLERLTLAALEARTPSSSDSVMTARALAGAGVAFGEDSAFGVRADFGYLRTHVEFEGLNRLLTCSDLTLQMLFAF
jgi:hypothetical protein